MAAASPHRWIQKRTDLFVANGYGDEVHCRSPARGRSDHMPVVLDFHDRRPALVPARLQPPRSWQRSALWKGILDKHMRSAEDWEGVQSGLNGAEQVPRAGEQDVGDCNCVASEDEKRCAAYMAKGAALRHSASWAPPVGLRAPR